MIATQLLIQSSTKTNLGQEKATIEICFFFSFSPPNLLIPVVPIFVLCQRISWTENLPTETTRNRDPSNMMNLNVVSDSCPTSFLSTHLAYPSSSIFPFVGIRIFAERHHWFYLLVQTFHISAVSCVVCKDKSLFTFWWLYSSIFIENLFVR